MSVITSVGKGICSVNVTVTVSTRCNIKRPSLSVSSSHGMHRSQACGPGSSPGLPLTARCAQAQESPPCRVLAARLAAAAAPKDSPACAAKARAARTHLPGAFADVTNVGGSASRARLRAQKAIVM